MKQARCKYTYTIGTWRVITPSIVVSLMVRRIIITIALVTLTISYRLVISLLIWSTLV